MFSIEVVFDTYLLGHFSRFLVNHFDTMKECTEYLSSPQWHIYSTWISYGFPEYFTNFNCIYTGF